MGHYDKSNDFTIEINASPAVLRMLPNIKSEYVLDFYGESDKLMAIVENISFKIMINKFPMDMDGIAMVASLSKGRHSDHIALILKAHGQILSMVGLFRTNFTENMDGSLDLNV